MSLAARCTHCHTVFRISGPQLAAAQGWVRCGQCGQVFDATVNLVTPQGQPIEVPTVDAPAPSPGGTGGAFEASSNAIGQAHAAPSPAALQPMPDIDLELPDLGALKAEAAAENRPVESSPAPKPTEFTPPEPEPERYGGSSQDLGKTRDLRDVGDVREPAWVEPSEPAPSVPPHSSAPAEPGASDEPTAPLAAPHSTPAPATGTGFGGLLIGLLLLTMAALLTFTARAHIAQAWPESRPWIVQACAAVGCPLPPLRMLEALEVQGSSLSLDEQTGHHTLRIQVHHRGDWPVLMPAFDFSVLDETGAVVARRMLDSTEFTPKTTDLGPGQDAELAILLNLKALEPATIGSFRVLPYYP